MGRVDGKVALVTGAARGQGRAIAARLAAEGADIIAIDVCAAVSDTPYAPASTADLDETAGLVRATGQRVVAAVADVRDYEGVEAATLRGASELGSLDIVVANAGINSWNRFWEMSSQQWQDVIDVNLTGVWHTLKAAAPLMIEQGRGGSIIITNSVSGIKALPAQAHYSASKHGLVGLCKSAAIELGPHSIRVNSIHPWGVDTPMGNDPSIGAIFASNPTYAASFGSILAEPRMATPDDIASAVLWLASDESRTVTAAQIPLDMGATKI